MMDVKQPAAAAAVNMTFDEASLERSKSFVKALQELKNLRPQLYSAAEYCEKSYLHSEQKQMVLDNLKDYAVRALVNAVDHLGTVAYKLTDVIEQQTVEVSRIDFNMSCLKQQLLTCQTYTDKEGLRQQQLLAFIPRHHKHYVLPNSVNKKVHFSPLVQTDARQTHFARSCLQPSGGPAAKTLSWHLASETKPSLKGTSNSLTSRNEDPKTSGTQTAVFQLVDKVDDAPKKPSGVPAQLITGGHPPSGFKQKLGVPSREMLESSKPLTAFRSFNTPKREAIHAPTRSKSTFSAFFVKQKVPKLKAGTVQ